MTPAAEAQLNDRQRQMVVMLQEGQRLTSRLCETEFAVTRDTTTRDFELLMKLGIARRLGKGRSTCYVLVTFA